MENVKPFRSRSYEFMIGVILLLSVPVLERAVAKEVTECRIQAASLEYANPAYLEPSTYVRVYRKSRGKTAFFSAFLPFHHDIPLDMKISFHAFQRSNNAWRSTVIRGSTPFCGVLETKNKIIKDMFSYSDFPHKCPVKKGNYSIRDLFLKGEIMPPMLQSTEYRTKVTWGTTQTNIFIFFVEVKVNKRGSGPTSFSDAMAVFSINKSLTTEDR